MQLVPGETYEVRDWYGMLSFEAEYVGVIRDANHQYPVNLHLVRRSPSTKGFYLYAGCEIRTTIGRNGEVRPYLYATHYGNRIEELEHCGGRDRRPKWELQRGAP